MHFTHQVTLSFSERCSSSSHLKFLSVIRWPALGDTSEFFEWDQISIKAAASDDCKFIEAIVKFTTATNQNALLTLVPALFSDQIGIRTG